jgi:hypothetical protein
VEILGIAMLAAGLMGAWHVTKYAVPRTARAMGRKRRAGIDAWTAAHPAPGGRAVARRPRQDRLDAALGPRFLADETKKAWREGLEHGKRKYGIAQNPPEPEPPEPDPVDHPPARPARHPPRPHLVAVPDPIPTLIGKPADNPKESTMTIQTVTGGEVTSPEQLVAELQAIVDEAAADLEDARGDAARADEDAARIEKMTQSITYFELLPEDIATVQALVEPAMSRKSAAEQRAAAAEKRSSQAQAALVMAQRHVELQGQGAAGRLLPSLTVSVQARPRAGPVL